MKNIIKKLFSKDRKIIDNENSNTNNPREELLNTMDIKSVNLKELSEKEINNILLKKIEKIKKLLYNFLITNKLDWLDRESLNILRSKQIIISKNVRNFIVQKKFIDAYNEIVNFVDNA